MINVLRVTKKSPVCRGEMDDDGTEITLMSCGKINTTSSWPYSPCRLQSHWGYLTQQIRWRDTDRGQGGWILGL